ncbi:MAG: hypothetical protein OEU36_18560 [Gammaproteobacteria bacterium]|nr:hypothetical protein [Gammaproteobacteria bacterium]
MYARVTKFSMNMQKFEESMNLLEEIRGQINAIPGLISIVHTVQRDTGNGMTVAVYPDEAVANAALETVKGIWGRFAEFMTGPPEMTGYEVIHHHHK